MTAKPKAKVRIVYRDSDTGRFVSKAYADANKATTQGHRTQPVARKKKVAA